MRSVLGVAPGDLGSGGFFCRFSGACANCLRDPPAVVSWGSTGVLLDGRFSGACANCLRDPPAVVSWGSAGDFSGRPLLRRLRELFEGSFAGSFMGSTGILLDGRFSGACVNCLRDPPAEDPSKTLCGYLGLRPFWFGSFGCGLSRSVPPAGRACAALHLRKELRPLTRFRD